MCCESFPALEAVPSIRACFVNRVPNLDLTVGREEALALLEEPHCEVRSAVGFGEMVFATAEQVHGNHVAVVSKDTVLPVLQADALVTTSPGVCLGIYVADCAAVYVADRLGRGIALVHSGKKGTELGIASVVVDSLCSLASISPADLVAQISPCIRPPHYETDFAAEITRQLRNSGVGSVNDCGVCTACHPDRYYSYRLEKGLTGRMLAMMAIIPPIAEIHR